MAIFVHKSKPNLTLSYIVRDMVSGCGDDSQLTSYNCFCSTNSSQFVDIIAIAVEDECRPRGTEVTSATSFFSAYFQVGNKSVATVTKTSDDGTSSESLIPNLYFLEAKEFE